jgi:hypothetical protein
MSEPRGVSKRAFRSVLDSLLTLPLIMYTLHCILSTIRIADSRTHALGNQSGAEVGTFPGHSVTGYIATGVADPSMRRRRSRGFICAPLSATAHNPQFRTKFETVP